MERIIKMPYQVLSIGVVDARNPGEKKIAANEYTLFLDDFNMDICNFEVFVRKLKELMNICDSEIRVSYVDDDADEVPIESDEELMEFMRIASYMEKFGEKLTILIQSAEPEMEKSVRFQDESVKKSGKKGEQMTKELVASYMEKFKRDKLTLRIQSAEPEMKKSVRFQDESVKKSGKKGEQMAKESLGGVPPKRMNEGETPSRTLENYEEAVDDSILTPEELAKTIGTRAPSVRTEELKELRHQLKQISKHVSKKIDKISVKQKKDDKVPSWFKDYMQEFKSEIISEVNEIVSDALNKDDDDDALEIVDTVQEIAKQKKIAEEEGSPLTAAAAAASANAEFFQQPRIPKLLRRLEKLQKREKRMEQRMDQRIEKMETKKKKMWEKVSANRCARVHSPKMGSGVYLMSAIMLKGSGPLRVAPCSKFTKVWKFLNNGSLPWTDKTELRLAWGSPGLEPDCFTRPCPLLEPNQIGTIAMTFKVPSHLGSYESNWHFFHMGERFGPWVSCAVIVEAMSNENAEHQICVEQMSEQMRNATLQETCANCESDADCDSVAIVCDSTDEEKSDDAFVVVPMPPCFFPNLPEDTFDPVPVRIKCKTSSVSEPKMKKVEAKNKESIVTMEDFFEDDDEDDEGAVGFTRSHHSPHPGSGSQPHLNSDAANAGGNRYETKESQTLGGQASARAKIDSVDYLVGRKMPTGHFRHAKTTMYENIVPMVMDRPVLGFNFNAHPVELGGSPPYHAPPPAFIHPPFMPTPALQPHIIPPPPFNPHLPPPGFAPQPILQDCYNYCVFKPMEAHGLKPLIEEIPYAAEVNLPDMASPIVSELPDDYVTQPKNLEEVNTLHGQHSEKYELDTQRDISMNPRHNKYFAVNLDEPGFSQPYNLQRESLNQRFSMHMADNPHSQFKEKQAGTKPKINITAKQTFGCIAKKQKAYLKCKKSKHQEHDFEQFVDKSSKKGKLSSDVGNEWLNLRYSKTDSRFDNDISKWKSDVQMLLEKQVLEAEREAKSSKNGRTLSDMKNGSGAQVKVDKMFLERDQQCKRDSHANKKFPDRSRPSNTKTTSTDERSRPSNTKTTSTDDFAKQTGPVHILPETLVNGAIGVASAAYSTALNAFNSLRPKPDELPVGDNEKFERGMTMLVEMGFNNYARNAELLRKFNFQISEVVENYCLNL